MKPLSYHLITLFFGWPQFIQTHFFSWIAFFKQKEREVLIASHAGLATQPDIHLHRVPIQRSCLNILQVLREIIEIRKLLAADHLMFFFALAYDFFWAHKCALSIEQRKLRVCCYRFRVIF